MTLLAVRRRAVAIGLAAMVVATVLVGCGGDSSTDVFCGRARTSAEIGPVFPDRTDGEPVPDPDALAALESMAADAPAELDEDMEVLVDTARLLAAEAEARRENGSEVPDSRRWSQRAVEHAQRAVVDYVDAHCDVGLTQTVQTGS